VAVSLVTCFEIPLFKASLILGNRSPVPSVCGTDSSPVASQRKREKPLLKSKIFHVRRYIGLLPLITISSSQNTTYSNIKPLIVLEHKF
jgi:hypothetical protein